MNRALTQLITFLTVMLALFVGSRSADADDGLKLSSGEAAALVEAFKEFCTPDLSSFENSKKRAFDVEWQPGKATDSPDLRRVISVSEEAIKSGAINSTHLEIFRKTIKQKTYYGVHSGVIADGNRLHGCYVYDFSAELAVPTVVLTRWLEQAPAKSAKQTGIQADVWIKPARLPGYLTVKSTFATRDAPSAVKLGLVGAALATTQLISSQ